MMRRLSLALCALLIVSVLFVGAVGAQANNTSVDERAPYYDEWEGNDVDNESWMDGNEDPTIENSTTIFTRIGTFVVGSNGDGSTGAVLTGMLVLGALLGIGLGAPIGTVAGGTLATAGVFAIASTGLSPEWTVPVAMFGVGLFMASVAKRLLQ